jgi:hypothetical protein
MTLRAEEVLLHPDAAATLERLDSDPRPQSRSIARRIRVVGATLLSDCLHGEVVRRSAIPKAIVARYGVENLFVEDLPDYWRLLYSVLKRGEARGVLIIAIVDHREYSRWFPGRGR